MKYTYFIIVIALSVILPHGVVPQEKKRYNIGLLVMATGKYTVFLEKLLASADRYFLPEHTITYFIFTDGQVPFSPRAVRIYQKRLGWPYDTMMRFTVYYNARDSLAGMDYLFACDADMLFVDEVGDEILGDRVATRHPGFLFDLRHLYSGHMYNAHDSYETNFRSTACIAPGKGSYYFAGGFYGGSRDEFLTMASVCTENIMQDLSWNYIAIWHDESHLNRYFVDHTPTVILSPSYCYPESWDLPFTKKLLALDKNHREFQVK